MKTYEEALHAMQSGVALEMEYMINNAHQPKHLRVGINSAMCDHAALVRLLVDKGLFTMEEYMNAIKIEMNEEVKRYEKRLSEYFGKDINLG